MPPMNQNQPGSFNYMPMNQMKMNSMETPQENFEKA